MGRKTRIIGGRKYWMHRHYTMKDEANNVARDLRDRGYNARVTKATKPYGWVVWSKPST